MRPGDRTTGTLSRGVGATISTSIVDIDGGNRHKRFYSERIRS
jgi:hypothetical protein